MDEPRPLASPPASDVTDPDHVWTEHELAMIAKGEADIAAGRFVEWDEVMAWFDAIDRGGNPPVPQSNHS